jgi:type IV pilus assembly protein PilB
MQPPTVRSRALAAEARDVAADYSLPFVDLDATQIDPAAVASIPVRVLERAGALPYRLDGETLHVAVADPSDVQALDELRLATRLDLSFAVATRGALEPRLRLLSAEQEDGVDLESEYDFDDSGDDGDPAAAPVVRLVSSIIVRAAEEGASDVHLLPQPDGLLVRFRVDGVLRDVERLPRSRIAGVLARVKVLAKLDIAEHRRPQDGRITLRASSGRTLDIRTAIIPGIEGEGAIMRLLDKSREAPTLTETGVSLEMQMKLEKVIAKGTGALLVTGPTGSGKSTTLYAALADLNRPEINIITVEDPVEYRVPGVFQVQVNRKVDLTFASALRSILRADPDVVMVGEIRDAETAKIATEAALTGHFVLSTLHTSDAPGAVSRLIEMGVEPFVVASSISAVLAQRLARRLCTECREAYRPSPEELDMLGLEAGPTLYRAVGCNSCTRGYRGRIGLFQLLVADEELRSAAVAGASHDELVEIAERAGMKPMWDDGVAKVAAGITTVDELRRVLN